MAIASSERDDNRRLQWILGEEADDRERLAKDQWATPQLFMGFGGTGTKAVTSLAQRLMRMVTDESNGQPGLPSCLQFLALDTDQNELQDHVINAGVEVLNLTVSSPELYWEDNQEVFQSLNFSEPLRVEMGAGGRRNYGRFAFVAHVDRIHDALRQALAEMQGYPGLGRNKDPRIHIFFSLVGGTGCGTFLDVAFLLRDLTATMHRTEINAYIVIPDNIVAPVPDGKMASAAGALKELEYFMQLGRGTPEFTGWRDAPRWGDKILYHTTKRVRGLVRRPFDLCYFFGSSGDQGFGTVGDVNHFAGVLAEAAIRNAFSPAGHWNRQRVVDINKHFEQQSQKKYASFSSIGYSRLYLPTDELGALLVLELAVDVCNYLLMGAGSWDRNAAEAKALRSTYFQRLTSKLSLEQAVAPNRLRQLNTAEAVAELEKLAKEKNNGRIKQACDAVPSLLEGLVRDSEKTLQATIKQRLDELRQIIELHADDLTVGLEDDIAFFNDLKGDLRQHHETSLKLQDKEKENLPVWLKRLAEASRFLSKSASMFSAEGIKGMFGMSSAFQSLNTTYQAATASVRDCLLARANAQLAAELAQEIELQVQRLSRARDHVAADLRARFDSRRNNFKSRVEEMQHGKVRDDCKTFCPVDVQRITEQAAQLLAPLKIKFGGLLNHAQRTGRLDLKKLFDGDPRHAAALRLEVLRLLDPEVDAENLWQCLSADGVAWGETLSKFRSKVAEAAHPLLKFSITPNVAVISCYSNFPEDERKRLSATPADLPTGVLSNTQPLVAQKDCVEVTRFFHGIRLRELAIAREMQVKYDAYMENLQTATNGRHTLDNVNLFPQLRDWPGPERGVKDIDKVEKLWALGLCFGIVFPPDEQQRKALNSADALVKTKDKSQSRKNYLFKVGNYYYLQPAYATPIAQAPQLEQLGRSRKVAFDAFCRNPRAIEEMGKWYDFAERIWSEKYTRPELQAAIEEYLRDLSGTPEDLVAQERIVVNAFMAEPFPE